MPFVKGQSGNPATQWKPGEKAPGSGKPKGAKHLSTWIQELLNDDEFKQLVFDENRREWIEYKGAPLKAIVQAQMRLALKGDHKSFDLLGKYGFGQKQEIDITSNGETVAQPIDMDMVTQFMMMAKDQTKQ